MNNNIIKVDINNNFDEQLSSDILDLCRYKGNDVVVLSSLIASASVIIVSLANTLSNESDKDVFFMSIKKEFETLVEHLSSEFRNNKK